MRYNYKRWKTPKIEAELKAAKHLNSIFHNEEEIKEMERVLSKRRKR